MPTDFPSVERVARIREVLGDVTDTVRVALATGVPPREVRQHIAAAGLPTIVTPDGVVADAAAVEALHKIRGLVEGRRLTGGLLDAIALIVYKWETAPVAEPAASAAALGSVPPVDEIARVICQARAALQMQGSTPRVSDDAQALHDWLAERSPRHRGTLRYRGHVVGRLIVSTCHQPDGAPIIDRGHTRNDQGREFRTRVLLLRPWQRNEYGDRRGGRALVIGWEHGATR